MQTHYPEGTRCKVNGPSGADRTATVVGNSMAVGPIVRWDDTHETWFLSEGDVLEIIPERRLRPRRDSDRNQPNQRSTQ